MTWMTLQLLQVASFLLIAFATHSFMARVRRPFLASLEGVAGAVVQRMAVTSEVVAALLYLAFAAAALPFDGVGPPAPSQIENVLDSVALFLGLVAAVQLVTLRALHRVAHNLEPWPPALGDGSTAQ